MTIEEAKELTKKQIKVMQAFLDGKSIECGIQITTFHGSVINGDEPSIKTDWEETTSPDWNWRMRDYRIKPEPTYQPYDANSFYKDAVKHHYIIKSINKMSMYISACQWSNSGLITPNTTPLPWSYLLTNYVWADDLSVCGVLVDNNE